MCMYVYGHFSEAKGSKALMEFLIISLVGRLMPVPEFGKWPFTWKKKGPLSWDPGNKKKLTLTWLSNQADLFSFYFFISFVTYL